MTAAIPANQPLPWHEALWRQINETRRADRMAHGLLICGPPGTGKRRFAARLAQALLCHAPQEDGEACGQCPGCRQWRAESHPDVSMLTPEKEGAVIKVDGVRGFTAKLQLTPQYNAGRLGWIEPADQLNNTAANSLLKTLEEPPAGTHLLLITGHPDRLLPTIRSRCRIIRVPPAPVEMARTWLAEQGVVTDGVDDDELHMPLRWLERSDDADELEAQWRGELAAFLVGRRDGVALAERWKEQPRQLLLEWLYRTACHLLACKLDASQPVAGDWAKVVNKMQTRQLQALCAAAMRASYLERTNADWQLILETVLRRSTKQ